MGLETNSFTNQYNRLTAVFGDRQLGPDVRERFWFYAQALPEEGIRAVVDELLDTLKFAPKPVEFKEAAIRWKRRNRKPIEKKESPTPIILCKHCYDTDYCFLLDPVTTQLKMMKCDHKNHPLKSSFPIERFKPRDDESLWEVEERWTKAKKVVDSK